MVGRLLVGSCGSIFRFLCHDWWSFSGVRVAQSFVFCVMVGRLLVGFVCLNLQFSVSWLVDFQWASCGSIFSFLSWLVDFQWDSCGSIFRFLCHGRYTFSGVCVAQSFVFCVMVGRLLVGFVWLNLQFSVSWQLYIYIYIGRLLVGFVWLNLQFSVAWLVDFQWGSCVSIFSFLCHGWQLYRLIVGFVWLYLQISMIWQVDFQLGSCGSIFRFLCHVRQTFSGVRVSQSLVFCVMVGRLLVGFVWLNLQFSVSWQVDFQWGSCGSIFSFLSWLIDFQWGSCGSISSFLCHGRQTFSGVRVAQSLVFCVMVGRLLVGFVWLKLQFSVSWQVDFQWGSCGPIFSFLRHGWQTFSGDREAQSLVFCVKVGDFQWGSCGSIFSFVSHGWQTFSRVRVAQSLVFCVIVRILLVGFVCLNLQFSASWLVDFQWASCVSIFIFLCHGWQTFSGVRVAQSLVFCVMVGRLLVGFVWLNLQISVSWQVDFQ